MPSVGGIQNHHGIHALLTSLLAFAQTLMSASVLQSVLGGTVPTLKARLIVIALLAPAAHPAKLPVQVSGTFQLQPLSSWSRAVGRRRLCHCQTAKIERGESQNFG